MAVDSKHPDYIKHLPDWQQLRDCYDGQRAVKDKGRAYLPATSGMEADGIRQPGTKGWNAYHAYLARALFPDLVEDAVAALIGTMHLKPPAIELPSALEPMRKRATLQGESLEFLLRRINEQQIIAGRVGLLLDTTPGSKERVPYIATYAAESVINWDEQGPAESLSMVVLEESENVRHPGGFEWKWEDRFRVLVLGAGVGGTEAEPLAGGQIYRMGVFAGRDRTFREDALMEPELAGRKLDEIPFVFANPKDIAASPDKPPLLGLSNIALAIYRGEADYRQTLFMQGQETLVISGGEDGKEYRVGATATLVLPIGGAAEYVGVSSLGLPEQRTALENDYDRAQRKAGQLIDETSRMKESGEALHLRVATKTTTLVDIAIAGSFALERLLRIAAKWVGANPDEVKVMPNLDFADDDMGGDELTQIMTGKMLGAPLSLDSIHKRMQDRGMTDKTWDEEMEAIEKEKELELVPLGSTSSDGPAAGGFGGFGGPPPGGDPHAEDDDE